MTDTAGEPRFVYTASQIEVGSVAPAEVDGVPFKAYAAAVRDSVRMLNEANGFVASTAQVDGQQPSEGGVAASTEKESAFTALIRDWFGEERQTFADDIADNIAVVGVRLNKMPVTDEPIILSVTHQSGDQSIKLEQNLLSTRFEFSRDNWDKTAYLFFEIDHKLKDRTEASFVGASGNIPFAWIIVFVALSVFFFAVAMYHSWVLPRPLTDGREAKRSASDILKEFVQTFVSFFQKKQIWVAVAFMLLYRLPEAQLVKLINPFVLDPIDKGGMGLSTGEVGLVYGTVGIIGLTIGGIIGGIAAARGGLKKWLWPMAWSMSLTCLTFVYLSYAPAPSLLTVNLCVFVEQFGYGFGFTAYMLFLIHFSDGPYKTSHYAICTGFMALSMMLGMMAGWLQEQIGYRHFFIWTVLCCVTTIGTALLVKSASGLGQKGNGETN